MTLLRVSSRTAARSLQAGAGAEGLSPPTPRRQLGLALQLGSKSVDSLPGMIHSTPSHPDLARARHLEVQPVQRSRTLSDASRFPLVYQFGWREGYASDADFRSKPVLVEDGLPLGRPRSRSLLGAQRTRTLHNLSPGLVRQIGLRPRASSASRFHPSEPHRTEPLEPVVPPADLGSHEPQRHHGLVGIVPPSPPESSLGLDPVPPLRRRHASFEGGELARELRGRLPRTLSNSSDPGRASPRSPLSRHFSVEEGEVQRIRESSPLTRGGPEKPRQLSETPDPS
jgi:hypothetical protein